MHPFRRTSLARTPTLPTLPREDNTQDNDHQPTMPLGIELTGYRLLTTGVILGFGIPKAVYSYKGQALISTTLDWVAGVILAVILFWLGEAKRPGRFYDDDLAPPILRFLSRPEVYLWFLAALPLLLSTTHMLAMLLYAWRYNHVHWQTVDREVYSHVIKDGRTSSMLAFCTAICMFCLQCVRVLRPRFFRVDPMRHALLLKMNLVVWLVYDVYTIVKIVTYKDPHPSMVKISPLVANPALGFPQEEMVDCTYPHNRWWCTWKFPTFPGFPEGLYGIFFLCFIEIFPFCYFFVSVPTSWIHSFADMQSASRAAYDGIRGAGNNAWAYIRHRV